MTVKLFIDSDNTVTLSCPRCNRNRNVDVSRFMNLEKNVRIQAKCPCGHRYPVTLERRRQYRKQTLLRGTYTCDSSQSPGIAAPCKGSMTVVDISRGGVRLRFNPMPDLRVGDRITVQFTLNDAQQTLINRDVVVQNIAPPFVGARYHRSDSLDNAIGFYLFR